VIGVASASASALPPGRQKRSITTPMARLPSPAIMLVSSTEMKLALNQVITA